MFPAGEGVRAEPVGPDRLLAKTSPIQYIDIKVYTESTPWLHISSPTPFRRPI